VLREQKLVIADRFVRVASVHREGAVDATIRDLASGRACTGTAAGCSGPCVSFYWSITSGIASTPSPPVVTATTRST
jgi:hypothetical protein